MSAYGRLRPSPDSAARAAYPQTPALAGTRPLPPRRDDACWSPRLEKNIGYVWVPIALAEPGHHLDVETEDGAHLSGVTAAIPFVDPRKERPAGALA